MKRTQSVHGKAALACVLVLCSCSLPADERGFTITSRGGQFNAWRMTLTAPPGAVVEPLTVTVTREFSTLAGIVPGSAHTLAPASGSFSKPVVLTIWLDSGKLGVGATASDLYIAKLTGFGWQKRGTTYEVNLASRVSASVLTLGTFAVWNAYTGNGLDGGIDLPPIDARPDAPNLDAAKPNDAGKDLMGSDLGPSDQASKDQPATDLPGQGDSGLALDQAPGDLPAADQPASPDQAAADLQGPLDLGAADTLEDTLQPDQP